MVYLNLKNIKHQVLRNDKFTEKGQIFEATRTTHLLIWKILNHYAVYLKLIQYCKSTILKIMFK